MQFLTSSVWLDTLTETLHANFSFCPQQSCSLSLLAAQVMSLSSPPAPNTHWHTTHCTTVKRGFKECSCFYHPPLEMLRLSPCPPPWRDVLFYFLFVFHLLFCCVLICQRSVTSCVRHRLYICEENYLKTKGTQHRGVGFFGTLLMWFSMFCRDLFSFCYPFWLCMIFFCGSCVLICMHVGVFVCFFQSCMCVSVIRETTFNSLIW